MSIPRSLDDRAVRTARTAPDRAITETDLGRPAAGRTMLTPFFVSHPLFRRTVAVRWN